MTTTARRLLPSLNIVLLTLGILICIAAPARAESKSLVWLRLDTEIDVQPNGDLRITETNVIRFTQGTFRFGFRDIDRRRLTDVRDVQVLEDGRPIQVELTETEDDMLRIKYYFSRPARDEQRTFTLRYTVSGALRYYPDGDQVYWVAVYADRAGFPVQDARVTVRLPAGASATNAEVYGVRADLRGLNEGVVIAEALAPIPSGREMEVRVQFPHGIVSGEPPPWQRAFDERRRFEAFEKPRYDLIALLAGLLVFFGGPAAVIALYYARGRDPNVGLVAEYLTEPPPDLSPGLAGTLVDETADVRDIVATLVDLARRGVLKISEYARPTMGGLLTTSDWQIEPGERFGQVALRPYEQALVAALGIAQGRHSLSEFRNRFYTEIPKIQNALYEALVEAGYYTRSPDQTRKRYRALANLVIFIAAVLFVIAVSVLSDLTEYSICLPAALLMTGLLLYVVARAMPLRTRKGAEMRMRAEAFKRYLQNIEKYTKLQEAKGLFDKYLPYAIAFGLDHSWLRKFTTVDAPPPPWYVPMSPYRPLHVPTSSAGVPAAPQTAQAGDISGQARAGGGIEGLERSLGGSIASLERSLASMFDSVATTLTSQPAPSHTGRTGRGWSGGGGFGGGGSGGGRGGFG